MLKSFSGICIVIILIWITGIAWANEKEKKVQKFSLPECEKFLLTDSDVIGYRLEKQLRAIWPVYKEKEEPKFGVDQEWRKSDKEKFYYRIWVFNSNKEALDGAIEYQRNVASLFQPGSFTGSTVGDASWIAVHDVGAGILFAQGHSVVLVGNSIYKEDEREELEEIAKKIAKKIEKVSKK